MACHQHEILKPRVIHENYLHLVGLTHNHNSAGRPNTVSGRPDTQLRPSLCLGHWPEAIEVAIESIETAPFLSRGQRRDSLDNNAAGFLRLSEDRIARHHGKQ